MESFRWKQWNFVIFRFANCMYYHFRFCGFQGCGWRPLATTDIYNVHTTTCCIRLLSMRQIIPASVLGFSKTRCWNFCILKMVSCLCAVNQPLATRLPPTYTWLRWDPTRPLWPPNQFLYCRHIPSWGASKYLLNWKSEFPDVISFSPSTSFARLLQFHRH